MEVAELNLKAIRKAAGITQVELAKAAFISQPLVVKIESGKQKPSVRVAKRIAKVLGFDWTLFFE